MAYLGSRGWLGLGCLWGRGPGSSKKQGGSGEAAMHPQVFQLGMNAKPAVVSFEPLHVRPEACASLHQSKVVVLSLLKLECLLLAGQLQAQND